MYYAFVQVCGDRCLHLMERWNGTGNAPEPGQLPVGVGVGIQSSRVLAGWLAWGGGTARGGRTRGVAACCPVSCFLFPGFL
jgi:hypothetical protein